RRNLPSTGPGSLRFQGGAKSRADFIFATSWPRKSSGAFFGSEKICRLPTCIGVSWLSTDSHEASSGFMRRIVMLLSLLQGVHPNPDAIQHALVDRRDRLRGVVRAFDPADPLAALRARGPGAEVEAGQDAVDRGGGRRRPHAVHGRPRSDRARTRRDGGALDRSGLPLGRRIRAGLLRVLLHLAAGGRPSPSRPSPSSWPRSRAW